MTLFAIDPGLKACGVAQFDDGMLIHAELVTLSKDVEDNTPEELRYMMTGSALAGFHFDTLAIEFPKVYVGSKQKGDQKDLLHLAALVGAITYGARKKFADSVTTYLPYEWKKQLDKVTTQTRVLERLSKGEQSGIVLAGAKSHNIYDAIGIGLHHLGRFKPQRIYAR
jgi:RNase H-fold protein (predicted Holliday junction resolvase)